MERDYHKDLEVCQSWPEKPWKSFLMDDTKDEYWLDGLEFICPDDYCYFTEEDAENIVFAHTTLPWYIKRCMDLESQLHQCREREKLMLAVVEAARNYYEHIGLPDMRLEEVLAALDSEGVNTAHEK